MKNYQNTVFNKDILEVKECFRVLKDDGNLFILFGVIFKFIKKSQEKLS